MLLGTLAFFVVLGVLLADSNAPKIRETDTVKPHPIDVNGLGVPDYSSYLVYLKQHAKTPMQYVLDKFKDHDVVILGEMHEVRENCEFFADLIDPLYHQAGVRYFAMELLRYRNTPLVNRLVTGKEYDQQLVLRIFRDCAHPDLGYKEYMDIIKAIWELNNKLPPQAEKFKVIALDKGDWESIDLPTSPSTKEYEEFVKVHDSFMADVIEREVLAKHGKALVQIGYMHSFTRYRLVKTAPRFGGILYEKYGDRIFQVCLHQPHFGPEVLTGGQPTSRPLIIDFIEKIMTENGNKPVGFDIEDSPFANLRDRSSLYFASNNEAVFSDIAQGYVFIKPLKSLNFRMTWVDGFINEENFERAEALAKKRGWIGMFEKRGLIKPQQCNTPEGLDKLFRLIHESP